MQWPINRLCSRNLKHKLSVWVKNEERLRETEHEEESHLMCELEQGGYLDGKREDVDTEFADKLMDMEKGSY